MGDPLDSLRQRYRQALAERAARVVDLLAQHTSLLSPETRHALLGELHTLKGEARMLGLSTLATLTHGIEDRIISETNDWDLIYAAVDAISLSLTDETSDGLAQDMLETICEAMGLTFDAPEPANDEHENEDSDAVESVVPSPRPQAKAQEKSVQRERWIQVDANVVDALCETLAAISTTFSKYAADIQKLQKASHSTLLRDLEYGIDELKASVADALVMSLGLRLTMIEPTLGGLAAHVRVLAKERGKVVDVFVQPNGVRVERDLLDVLREPLLHLCTNAVVHGIENPQQRGEKPARARITLSAETSGSNVIVKVTDDGRGIDTNKLKEHAMERGLVRPSSSDRLGEYGLLFSPGFSTHDSADEVAGRGVGLDVVRRQVEGAQGTIEVTSQVNVGSTFSLQFPTMLTQEHIVVCSVGPGLYGIPAHLVISIEPSRGTFSSSYRFGDQLLPLRSLAALLAHHHEDSSKARVIILRIEEQMYALWAPEVLGHFELLRRPTSPALKARTGFSANTQLDDGRLVLIIDTPALLSPRGTPPASAQAPVVRTTPRRVLVVDDSVVVRDLIMEILAGAGYETASAENGVKALSLIDTFRPGLVLSDIEMPQMDGFELLSNIRQKSDTLPVILVSARSSTADRQRAATLGASAYVAKGEFEGVSLIQLVDRYCPRQP